MHRGFAAAAFRAAGDRLQRVRATAPGRAELDGELHQRGRAGHAHQDQLWKQQTEDGNANLVYDLREAELQTWNPGARARGAKPRAAASTCPG